MASWGAFMTKRRPSVIGGRRSLSLTSIHRTVKGWSWPMRSCPLLHNLRRRSHGRWRCLSSTASFLTSFVGYVIASRSGTPSELARAVTNWHTNPPASPHNLGERSGTRIAHASSPQASSAPLCPIGELLEPVWITPLGKAIHARVHLARASRLPAGALVLRTRAHLHTPS